MTILLHRGNQLTEFKRDLIALHEPQFTAMAPEQFRLDPGWAFIFEKLCCDVAGIMRAAGNVQFIWVEIKEKGGSLRAAAEVGTCDPETTRLVCHQIQLALFEAIGKSEKTCIVCGEPGYSRREQIWKMPVCDAHVEVTRQDLNEVQLPLGSSNNTG